MKKAVQWMAGIVLAGMASLIPANLIMHHTGKYDMDHLTAFQYWIVFLAVPSIAFGLFVFLACVFVSGNKKYAGLLVLFLCLIFIGLGSWQHYTDNGLLQDQYIIRYTGIMISLGTAFFAGHRLYRHNKWV